MKPAALLLALVLLSPLHALAQANDIPSAAPPHQSPDQQAQRGRQLLDQMVTALGGNAWLNRHDASVLGRTAAFFRGAPTGFVVNYSGFRRFATDDQTDAERIGFITDKSMILPGKKIDIVQIYVDKQGYEITYKGKTPLPADQVADYNRRQAHSIESVVRDWLKQPDVMVLYDGNTSVERRLADKITVLSANNDAVTIELDASSHLPLRRTFEWRNNTFQDHDQDQEEYDDYHTIQGLPTALTLSRYHNGDLTSQRFITKITYNLGLSPQLFNPDNLLKKKP